MMCVGWDLVNGDCGSGGKLFESAWFAEGTTLRGMLGCEGVVVGLVWVGLEVCQTTQINACDWRR